MTKTRSWWEVTLKVTDVDDQDWTVVESDFVSNLRR
jgi:hypothetical protein